jgi:hypothetical protein
MPVVKKAGASAHMPLSSPARGRTGRLSQAVRTTSQGASQASSAKANLSTRRVR